jgi:hypothetical protein
MEGRNVVTADVRWYLDGASGRAAYDAGHLPGAVFVDLDSWLSGSSGPHASRVFDPNLRKGSLNLGDRAQASIRGEVLPAWDVHCAGDVSGSRIGGQLEASVEAVGISGVDNDPGILRHLLLWIRHHSLPQPSRSRACRTRPRPSLRRRMVRVRSRRWPPGRAWLTTDWVLRLQRVKLGILKPCRGRIYMRRPEDVY